MERERSRSFDSQHCDELKLQIKNKLMEIERSRSFDIQHWDELKSQIKHFQKLVSGQCEKIKILSKKIYSLTALIHSSARIS